MLSRSFESITLCCVSELTHYITTIYTRSSVASTEPPIYESLFSSEQLSDVLKMLEHVVNTHINQLGETADAFTAGGFVCKACRHGPYPALFFFN